MNRYSRMPFSDGLTGRPVEKPAYGNLDRMSAIPDTGTMTVVNSPGTDCALTNRAYIAASDLSRFLVRPGLTPGYALVGNSMVLTVEAHDSIKPGTIGLNAIHRRNVKVSANDSISVISLLEWFAVDYVNLSTYVVTANKLKQHFAVPERGFDLVMLTVELEFVKFRRQEQLDAEILTLELKRRFVGQVFSAGQKVTFEYVGTNYTFSVVQTVLDGKDDATRGRLTTDTHFVFETPGNSGIKILNQSVGVSSNLFKQKDFNFQKLGIGGLDNEFQDIFRRAFASRVFPPNVISKLGITHVKGMLLWGPPGTGKTLIARQIGKMLNGKEPKIVNGPEILSKFVGETEKNVRDLFADAEKDQRDHGDGSELHIIIFDEIDAICKSRGTVRDGTGVHDSIVNQLLTKIDGVESLNNILLIGMTNRKDMLDEALLRPGRLEVQIEIGLPDEKGRVQILNIHSNKMKQNSFLSDTVHLEELASRTKNFSGAELEGLVKSAVSFALNRQVNFEDLNRALDEENIKVTMDDFLEALKEVKPAFGAATSTLEMCRLYGMLDCGERHSRVLETGRALVEQVKTSERTPLLSCLVEGPSGSGKTALAATIAMDSDFPFIKVVSAESMVGMSESSKCNVIAKIFEDAYRSPLNIIILDDIERILEYVSIGPRFSNLILQTLLVLIKRVPPKGRKLLVIGTTSMKIVMESMEIVSAFNVSLHVPALGQEDMGKVLRDLNVFAPDDVNSALNILVEDEMPIKKLLMLVEMAAQGNTDSEGADAVHAGKEKISLLKFRECYNDLTA